ncbi:MAG TPA: S8 family serine peptidase, partial [Streptosporangiaceae bacterium]
MIAAAGPPAAAAVTPPSASFGRHVAQTPAPEAPRSSGTSALGPWRTATAPRPGTGGTGASGAGRQVLVVLGGATTVTGSPLAGQRNLAVRAPVTSSAAVNSALGRVGATSVRPLMPQLSSGQAAQLHSAAEAKLGSGAVDLSRVEVVDLSRPGAASAARELAATPGIAYAEADQTVSPMSTGPVPLPGWAGAAVPAAGPAARPAPASPAPAGGVPGNYGLSSSLQSFLNAGGVDASGAYSLLAQRFGQLPGTGETITNVSIGDLTDAAMAAADDPYVKQYGPTTIMQNGQRYLDIPSMPLIPTFTSDAGGVLNPAGSAEYQDPQLGEVLLDFSVMAPLPHDQQRAGLAGSGPTDLLGIAPGAQYRLVVPAVPTLDQVAVALLAAAQQTPRPDVITASLGVGTDVAGFPGRYLEDDPIEQAVIAAIVQQYGITVVVSSNDGTRLYTNAAVGPDGGSTPTDLARRSGPATNVNDDEYSTTPSVVPDSGAIAAGGTTTDDTLAVPPQDGGTGSATGTWAATRTDGSGAFSSGFGTRVDVSAPSDAIPAFVHAGPTAESVQPVLNGGTSASAPEIAAAAAVVRQASRLTGQQATPDEVRALLERTGRPVATPPQADRTLHVGPQLDVTAAVEAVLGRARGPLAGPGGPGGPTGTHTQIVRLSVAHRQTIGGLGGDYTDVTDPGLIDLAGPGTGAAATGEGLVGPVTIGADVTGLPGHGGVSYALRIGSHVFGSATPSIRLTPAQILTAAGQPVIATANRQVSLTFEVLDGRRVLASASHQLTFGPTDGGYA